MCKKKKRQKKKEEATETSFISFFFPLIFFSARSVSRLSNSVRRFIKTANYKSRIPVAAFNFTAFVYVLYDIVTFHSCIFSSHFKDSLFFSAFYFLLNLCAAEIVKIVRTTFKPHFRIRRTKIKGAFEIKESKLKTLIYL